MSESATGRDMDALIAERVMGWHREPQPKDYDGNYGGEPMLIGPGESLATITRNGFTLPPRGQVHLAYFVPRYSTDYEAVNAMEQKLIADGLLMEYENALMAEVIGKVTAFLDVGDVFAMSGSTCLQRCRAALTVCALSQQATP